MDILTQVETIKYLVNTSSSMSEAYSAMQNTPGFTIPKEMAEEVFHDALRHKEALEQKPTLSFLIKAAAGPKPLAFVSLKPEIKKSVASEAAKLYKREIAGENSEPPVFVVLDDASKFIGGLWLDKMFHPDHGEVESVDVVITPKFQKKGIGSALMTTAIKDAKKRKVVAFIGSPISSGGLSILLKFGFIEGDRGDEYILGF